MAFPSLRQGITVFTNGDRGAAVYREVIETILGDPQPCLRVEDNPAWVRLMT